MRSTTRCRTSSCRYWRMKGRDVLWQPGTDHAGIATQMVVERQLLERQEPDRRAHGPREVPRAGLGVEGRIGRRDRRPAQAPRRLLRLEPRALHARRGPVAGGRQGVRPAPSRRADLQGQAARQLGPEVPDRDLRPRSRAGRVQGLVQVVARRRRAARRGGAAPRRWPRTRTAISIISNIRSSTARARRPARSSPSRPRGPRRCSATPRSRCIPTTRASSI